MINYKQILEAINHGIKFALDDFDDNEQIQGQTNSKVKNISNIKEYFEWQHLICKLKNKQLTKFDISYLALISKLLNLKYIVNSNEELKNIIKYINDIDSEANLNWIDTSNIIDMSHLFESLTYFNGDISEWNVSHVENMYNMFYGCEYFNQPLNNWDISSVKEMSFMFYKCLRFNQPLNNWDISKTQCRWMFYKCPIKNEYMPKNI